MIEVDSLGCERNNQVLFGGLTFKVVPGSMLLVMGANGSGKSSLLRILAGLSTPSQGTLQKAECLYLGHKLGIHPALTPLENLAWLLGLSDRNVYTKQQLLFALKTVGLEEFENTPCEMLSRGQNQRVALARLWVSELKCWILDEPFTGLDDGAIGVVCRQLLQHLGQAGIVVLASHYALELGDVNCETLCLENVAC